MSINYNHYSGERYTFGEEIGKGTYGKVYKSFDNIEKKYVAIKKLKFDPNSEGIPATAIREISLLKELNHKNIVKLIEVTSPKDKQLCLIFE